MSPLLDGAADAIVALVAGVAGGAAWARWHRHPDLVTRDEFDLILTELRYIRERLDRLAEDR